MKDPIRPSTDDLYALVTSYALQIKELKAQNIALQQEIAILKDKLNVNSNNSSLPPSMDLKRPKREKKPTNRTRGGQKGRKGVFRALVPSEQVDKIMLVPPPSHCTCGGKVCADTPKIWRHQQVELPPIKPHITEYQLQRGRCTACRKRVYAPLPVGVAPNMMGPRLMATATMLKGRYHLSVSKIQHFFQHLTGIKISAGCLSQTEARVAKSLAPIFEEIQTQARGAANLHMDETGYRQMGKRAWSWIACNEDLSLFKLSTSRGKKVIEEILGKAFGGIVTSDRYPAYFMIPTENRQICWAHIIRDFERFANSQDAMTRELGSKLLAEKDRVFKVLAQHKNGESDEKTYLRTIADIRLSVRKLLEFGATLEERKNLSRVCKNILKVESALWRFTEYIWLDLTNNQAERDIRALVIGRKISLGTQSERGSRFIERLYSVMGTCQKQAVDLFGFLIEAIKAAVSGQPAPSPFKA